ncbi:65-kDa microtubule-associated protein 3 [Panicum miliaceum]|uniref:65-kDa microtubule-associated protein 3 n=1 Tax=Panicum miliaceum TaxID=4540 RepID=A0A3L6RQY6_PANMI|nr:65-kDa microtubule-associated protein 3 [Panicum miliaceum]
MLSLKLRAILFPFQMEPRREELLHELGEMWDEIGEGEEDRRGMLQALEEECLNVYRAKVEQVRQHRAQLKREIADSVAEVAAICATIGEPTATVQTACSSLQGTGSLKEELGSIAPELAEMRRRREERRRQFSDVTERVNRIHQEMNLGGGQPRVVADSSDLTLTKLEELRAYLQHLQSEKESRTRKVAELMASLHSSSLVLGMNPREIIAAHGGDQAGHFSDDTIARLASEIEGLREIKRSRMEKLQDLLASMLELWNLMDTPAEEQRRFQGVACNIAASEDEITEPNALSMDFIRNVGGARAVEAEVVRLETLKECRMKDLVVKKYDELKEIRRRARLPEEDDGDAVAMFDAIDSDAERALILERLEVQISEAKDLEFSRKDVLERMDKWQAALEEESWLEEYNRNENRYNVGKGTHLVLKRAEKARALVSKMPAMAEALTAKVVAWEKERGVKFEYDGVRLAKTYGCSCRNKEIRSRMKLIYLVFAGEPQEALLDMLEEYSNARKEKEQERKRQRDQRRLQGAAPERDASPVARPPPKNIKNVTRTLSMGGSARKASASSSRPRTPSFLKSPMSARRGGSDEGQMMASDSFE